MNGKSDGRYEGNPRMSFNGAAAHFLVYKIYCNGDFSI
jgi:hypothetical protein